MHLPVGDIGYYDWGYEYFTWHELLTPVVRALSRFQLPATLEAEEVRNIGSIYMFGVAQGESIETLTSIFPYKNKFGFDSFEGLPPEIDKLSKAENWKPGAFKPRATIEKLVQDGGGPDLTKIVRGFFNESLTSNIVKMEGMGPAFYVDIDCDLYASTYPALDFLFANRIARVGTLIGYDD